MTEVGRVGKRVQHDDRVVEEGAITRGRGGGSQALRRIATQRPSR